MTWNRGSIWNLLLAQTRDNQRANKKATEYWNVLPQWFKYLRFIPHIQKSENRFELNVTSSYNSLVFSLYLCWKLLRKRNSLQLSWTVSTREFPASPLLWKIAISIFVHGGRVCANDLLQPGDTNCERTLNALGREGLAWYVGDPVGFSHAV